MAKRRRMVQDMDTELVAGQKWEPTKTDIIIGRIRIHQARLSARKQQAIGNHTVPPESPRVVPVIVHLPK
jgi:hypothetical protein